ncbi:phage tail length tape-measure protein 1 [Klebsiella pneumoniae]|uniref:Phage tail length tape-measure protein 1 n=1 Tax=Klebsiella pneumoniae TaxID=573 RepID=A0A377TWN2_KLEPN|nr:phage tail length tape-measure protein 1 [Klebsiella pneumoniae]
MGCSVVFLAVPAVRQVVVPLFKARELIFHSTLSEAFTILRHFLPTAMVFTALPIFCVCERCGCIRRGRAGSIMPLTRGADGSLGVRAVGRESPAVQNAASQIQAQPRIAVSVDARSTFTGKPDDITMQAVERRNNALEQRIINSLTAEIDNPQKKFGRAIYSNLQSKKPR